MLAHSPALSSAGWQLQRQLLSHIRHGIADQEIDGQLGAARQQRGILYV